MEYEYKEGHVFTYDSHGADSGLDGRSGTAAEIISPLAETDYDRSEVGDMYKVRFFSDGYETDVFADEITELDMSKYQNLDVYVVEPEFDILRNYFYNEQSEIVEEEVIYNLSEFMLTPSDGLTFTERFRNEARNYPYYDKSDYEWFVKEVEAGKKRIDNHITIAFNEGDMLLMSFCEYVLDNNKSKVKESKLSERE